MEDETAKLVSAEADAEAGANREVKKSTIEIAFPDSSDSNPYVFGAPVCDYATTGQNTTLDFSAEVSSVNSILQIPKQLAQRGPDTINSLLELKTQGGMDSFGQSQAVDDAFEMALLDIAAQVLQVHEKRGLFETMCSRRTNDWSPLHMLMGHDDAPSVRQLLVEAATKFRDLYLKDYAPRKRRMLHVAVFVLDICGSAPLCLGNSAAGVDLSDLVRIPDYLNDVAPLLPAKIRPNISLLTDYEPSKMDMDQLAPVLRRAVGPFYNNLVNLPKTVQNGNPLEDVD